MFTLTKFINVIHVVLEYVPHVFAQCVTPSPVQGGRCRKKSEGMCTIEYYQVDLRAEPRKN